MIEDSFYTIETEATGFYSEKGSKFYAFAYPVKTEEEVKEKQQILRKKYYDARHHVYAFMIGADNAFYRASDDGEPANSSGTPVLGQIKSLKLSNVLVVVVRYFGGTKLGVPGLINAYKTAAREALDNANIIVEYIKKQVIVRCSYEDINFVMKNINDFDAKIVKQEFLEDCFIISEVRASKYEQLINNLKTNHKLKLENNV